MLFSYHTTVLFEAALTCTTVKPCAAVQCCCVPPLLYSFLTFLARTRTEFLYSETKEEVLFYLPESSGDCGSTKNQTA